MKNDEGIKLCGVLNINKPLGITSFDVVRPVSYTHLDVYKRQCSR